MSILFVLPDSGCVPALSIILRCLTLYWELSALVTDLTKIQPAADRQWTNFGKGPRSLSGSDFNKGTARNKWKGFPSFLIIPSPSETYAAILCTRRIDSEAAMNKGTPVSFYWATLFTLWVSNWQLHRIFFTFHACFVTDHHLNYVCKTTAYILSSFIHFYFKSYSPCKRPKRHSS